TRPLPWHDLHGSLRMLPCPLQVGQARCTAKKPPPCKTTPWPAHVWQSRRLLFSVPPDPLQTVQPSSRRKRSCLLTPLAASGSSSSISTRTSRPPRGPPRRLRPPPPKKLSKRSPNMLCRTSALLKSGIGTPSSPA